MSKNIISINKICQIIKFYCTFYMNAKDRINSNKISRFLIDFLKSGVGVQRSEIFPKKVILSIFRMLASFMSFLNPQTLKIASHSLPIPHVQTCERKFVGCRFKKISSLSSLYFVRWGLGKISSLFLHIALGS